MLCGVVQEELVALRWIAPCQREGGQEVWTGDGIQRDHASLPAS
ncbi:hypothetical protein GCM10010346_64460 [Streptomyces chryseus]|uniref:Uncharacterized protein n=1 Tax=Streptomyces chryseus TaxID=68186 RepID=A0ABQ3EB71_9ACTN|nr:hypothetical protein GCM10010346_64460 [Streptomyces chryseus]